MLRAPVILLLLLLVLATSASAAEVPADTLLTGGLVTNQGSAHESLTFNTSNTDHSESVDATWDGAWLVADPYAAWDEPHHVLSLGGAEQEPQSYGATVSGTSRTVMPKKTQTCTITGTPFTPVLTPPTDGTLTVPGFSGATPKERNCSDGGTSSGYGTDKLTHGQAAFRLGAGPRRQRSLSQPVSESGDEPCVVTTGIPTCHTTWTVGGTATLTCALCVESMAFEQDDVGAAPGALVPVAPDGITDGNRVFVTVKVRNRTRFDIRSSPGVTDRRTGRKVEDPELNATAFPAGRTTSVTFEWDTSGWAWEGQTPASDRDLTFDTGLGAGIVAVKVLPRPVVLVHGWKATADGWKDGKVLLRTQVHPGLAGRTFAVGDGAFPGAMNTDRETGTTIDANAASLATYVQKLREHLDAQRVDLVVHSMGGLISRAYVQDRMPDDQFGRPVVRRLLMFGTPNMGSPCAVLIGSTGEAGSIATNELSPDWVVDWFNPRVTDRRGVRFAILAADFTNWTCTDPTPGDGVVALPSALWEIADRTITEIGVHHVNMTDEPSLYRDWVLPRLAADPDAIARDDAARRADGRRSAAAGRDAAAAVPDAVGGTRVAVPDVVGAGGTRVAVPAGQTVEVPVRVSDGDALVAALDAGGRVRSALVAPDGHEADVQAADAPTAGEPVRVQRVVAPTAGAWKLRLTAPGAAADVVVGFGLPGSRLVLRATGGKGRLVARLADGGAPVAGATVTATVRRADGTGAPARIALADDGAHGDGAAGDGTYGASVADLPADGWFAAVRAVRGDDVRTASTSSVAGTTGGGTDPGNGGTGGGSGGGAGDGGGAGGSGAGDGAGAGSGGAGGAGGGAGAGTGAGSGQAGGGAGDAGGSGAGGVAGSCQAGSGAGGKANGGRGPRDCAGGGALRFARLRVAPARDRRAPFAFRVSGTLRGCTGPTRVTLVARDGRRVVARVRARTSAGCRFAAVVRTDRRAGRFVLTSLAPGAQPAKVRLRAG